MSYFKKFPVFSFVLFLFYTSLTQAGWTTKFSEPGQMCFSQTSLRADPESNDFSSVMLDHYLIISEEDRFKDGLVFVGFRIKSQPDALWLFDGESWTKHNGSDSPKPFIPHEHAQIRLSEQLQPVIRTFISNYPIDASAYIGDGEIWVGYGTTGFRTRIPGEPPKDIPAVIDDGEPEPMISLFDEMINSGRFNLVWEVGNPIVADAIVLDPPNIICLSITELTVIDHLIRTQ